jgi:hypothetical protein
VLKLLILAFHFSSYRSSRIDPHAAHLLANFLRDKSSLKNVVPLTADIELVCPNQAVKNQPIDVDQNKQAA